MHCDYGHAYLTCTIWSRAKRLRQPLFHLTFWYFSLPFSVCILHHLLSFLLWKCIEKKNQMWSDYRFLIFSKMSVPSPRKKKFGRLYFLINSWRVIFSWPLRCRCVWFRYCLYSRDPSKFPCKIVLPGVSQEFSENFFALICTFFGTGDGGEWLQKRGSGRVKPNLFIACRQSAFQSGQTDYLSPFFTQTTSQFSQDTPSSTSFFAKFIAYVTSGWKFDRTDQTALCFKIASVI